MVAPHASGSVFERHPKKVLFLLVLIPVLLLDWVLGYVLIPADAQGIRIEHPYYHHGLKDRREREARWGSLTYPMYTNSLGFRDRAAAEVAPQSQAYRVVLMGDSHTEGVGVTYEESFAGRLAAHLDTAGIEVLNAGVVSYSPKLYFLKTRYLLETVGLDFDALHVFIDISDIQNEFAYERFEPQSDGWAARTGRQIMALLRQQSFIFYATRKLYEDRQREAFYKAVTQQQIEHNNTVDIYQTFFSDFDDKVLLSNPDFHTTLTDWYDDQTMYERWGKKGVSLMAENMELLVDLCREHAIELTISVHPWRTNIRKGNPRDKHVQYWQNFARDHQAGFLNLYPAFVCGADADTVIDNYYLPGDNHWNAAGHRRISEKLIPYIRAQKRAAQTSDARFFAGLKSLEWGNFEQAAAAFDEAVLQPAHAGYPHLMRGYARMNLGEFGGARRDLQEATAWRATRSEATRLLRDLSWHERIYLVSRALGQLPADSLFVQRGQAYLALRNYQLAQEDFLEANRLNTRNKEPYYYLGMIEHRYRRDQKTASTYLNRAIQLDPDYLDAYQERAEVLQALGNEAGASRDRERVERLIRSSASSGQLSMPR